MKDISVWLVAFIMIIFAARYTFQIWKRQISPTLSTWIVFILGTGLSLTTYAIAENHDLRSGILNAMDVISVTTVLIAIIISGNRSIRFKPFEKWYLAGIALIVGYGIISGDAWTSNIFTQVLISIGYIPMIHNLVSEKKNVESFTGWGLGATAGLVGLYPAIDDGNSLAIVYASRTILMTSSVIAVMAYYELRSKKSRS